MPTQSRRIDMIRAMTPEEYAEAWEYNAKQHFDDGDYEWICDQIQQLQWEKPVKRILEVGCGVGYSTLIFILRDFDVISIDANEAAIEKTKSTIEGYDYSPEEDLKLIEADVVHNFKRIYEALQEAPVDLIVLCNPGGNLSKELTIPEKKWLSIKTNTPLLLIQRDVQNEIVNSLRRIGEDGSVRLIKYCLRQINKAPDLGIPLSNESNDDIWWGMGLYFPA